MWPLWSQGSGPWVARVFQSTLALIFLAAFVSLGVQVDLMIGNRGLLPADDFLTGLHQLPGASLAAVPTVFWWGVNDAALSTGAWFGVALSSLALVGVASRPIFPVLAALYLSYVTLCRDFYSFQWDNLLIECGVLAAFLPRDRAAPWIHALFRLLLFKLYFESGVAKWQSYLGDWQDGTAMTIYYETAPLPGPLAWFAHHLPESWHHFESRAALVVELGVPFLIVGPRPLRLGAVGVLTGFQLANLLTANYGFFVYNALALHLFCLDDRDVTRVWRRAPAPLEPSPPRPLPMRGLALLGLAAIVAASTVQGLSTFANAPRLSRATEPLRRAWAPFRFVNNYHLFGHITRHRIEPSFETRGGDGWTEHEMHYKPGPPGRRPPWVAPHQPRVDFLLWFYGLSFRRQTPAYVTRLVDQICRDPDAVQPLFADELPARPDSVRILLRRYRFTTPEERAQTGDWWERSEPFARLGPFSCR